MLLNSGGHEEIMANPFSNKKENPWLEA